MTKKRVSRRLIFIAIWNNKISTSLLGEKMVPPCFALRPRVFHTPGSRNPGPRPRVFHLAPSFRVFDPMGVTRINFTYRCDALPTELWSHTLVARSIYWVYISREEWNDMKKIHASLLYLHTLLPRVNHVHSPWDQHWLFYHVYERFNCQVKINGRVIK